MYYRPLFLGKEGYSFDESAGAYITNFDRAKGRPRSNDFSHNLLYNL